MLVQEGDDRGWGTNIRSLEVLPIGRIEPVSQLAWITDQGVERITADAQPIVGPRLIRGAVKHRGAGQMTREQSTGEEIQVGVPVAPGPVHHIVGPTVGPRPRFAHAVVVDVPVLVIVSVKLEGCLQLLGIVQAHHASSLRLSSRQGRQEEGCQNGNDRNDDQEFDEGETTGTHDEKLRNTGPQRKPQACLR